MLKNTLLMILLNNYFDTTFLVGTKAKLGTDLPLSAPPFGSPLWPPSDSPVTFNMPSLKPKSGNPE